MNWTQPLNFGLKANAVVTAPNQAPARKATQIVKIRSELDVLHRAFSNQEALEDRINGRVLQKLVVIPKTDAGDRAHRR